VRNAPVIGLTAYCEDARWSYWHKPAVLLPANYTAQVAAAGGVPVLLPPVPGIAAAVERIDGLLLTGGGDIDPGRYGADPHPATSRVSGPRDAAELELLDAAVAAGKPVLGVCRGMQLLNVARGGTLCQHLPNGAGHTPAPGTFGAHPVRVAAGTLLAKILGTNGSGVDVPTAHHQAIERLGDGLVATAWAEDGVIEAVEPSGAGDPFLLAVQWHPEAGTDPRLIEALVAASSSGMSL
jgi:putative glutamine amidotransferase